MKRVLIVLSTLVSLLLAGVALGQGAGGESFAVIQEIGRVRPRGIQYNPHFDQFVMVDPLGRLLLVDATNFETQHVLYDGGTYSTYQFSHDGRWLALAIDRRVELWNTQTGELAASIETDGSRGIQGLLQFSEDDTLLLFDSVVPAPEDIRRSENDTVNLPWLWDLPNARDEAYSTLPNRVDAYPFFGLRSRLTTAFVLGPNNIAIGAIPERLQVMDLSDPSYPVLSEIITHRNEPDPISVWFSLRDEQIYVRPIRQNNLVQVNTDDGSFVDIPVGHDLTYGNMDLLDALILSDQARIIGEPHSQRGNSFLRLLLGDDYRRRFSYHPLTVTLLDILKPVTVGEDQMGLLIYLLDEETGHGVIEFLRPTDTMQMVLHPDNTHFMVRRASGAQQIEVYNLDTGVLVSSYTPALRDPDGRHTLTYNATGTSIISDFQRFDAATGEVLSEDLSYTPSFDRYFFTQDSQRVVTLTGSDWWLWDIETGEVIRRERVNLRGTLLETTPDGHRFLTAIDTPDGPGMEIVDVGSEERPSVVFERLPDRDIIDILPSPDWQHYLVIYSSNSFGPHYPGNEIAIYNLYEGRRWFIAGDDLPSPDGRSYGWLDNETVYVYSEDFGGPDTPARIYGLEYHASGLPACLVEAFPDEWTRWIDLWERLNARMRSDSLGRLTVRLCETLPGTVDDIEAVFHPTPTPTRAPVTPTPSFVAGVPACLTGYFPEEALDYAEAWREMTEGLTPEEVAEFEALLCEGLTGAPSPPRGEVYSTNVELMLIDVHSGARSLGTFMPRQERTTRSLQVVLDEFQRTERFTPSNAMLSPDGLLLAATTPSGHLVIYRLLTPYETIAANATATAIPQQEQAAAELPNSISVRPTATQPFDDFGGPRPTLTPTITPTAPPPPSEVVEQPSYEQVETFCEAETRYALDDPPPGYSARGRLLVPVQGSRIMWVLDVATGFLYPDETIPRCSLGLDCDFSFDQEWILVHSDDLLVSRPDGSEAMVLFEAVEGPVWPENIYWLDPDTIEYRYQGFLPDRFADAVTLLRRFDLDTMFLSEPFLPPRPVRVNELETELITQQPGGGPLLVVRTSFNTGRGIGYRYFIYDRETDEIDYFARLADYPAGEMQFGWHPLGTALYYRYPGGDDWYRFDTATREHRLLGDLPDGQWSRDGRYRVTWYLPPSAERQAQLETGLMPTMPPDAMQPTPTIGPSPTPTFSIERPTPTMGVPSSGAPGATPTLPPVSEPSEVEAQEGPLPRISIWDSETGLTRRYCLPGVEAEPLSAPFTWSPDNRYLAFRIRLPEDGGENTVRPRLLVLDTETGDVTELSFDVGDVIVWTNETPEESR